MAEPLILDTHVFIWLMNGSKELSDRTRQMIDAHVRKAPLMLPAISLWEIAMLSASGRIILSKPTKDWLEEALEAPAIELLPLTPEIAIESANLPGGFHGDPADRLIVASARVQQNALLTRDQRILDYAKDGYLTGVKV